MSAVKTNDLQAFLVVAQEQQLQEIADIRTEVNDRYGPLPEEGTHLLFKIMLKVLARHAGVSRLDLKDQRLVLEYKFFEPAFYHTDVPDWGTSYAHVAALGDRAKVCLDTGHHAPGTNIEFIVMQLLRLGKLGSFDFNSRNYADDDLIVGAADPFQPFRVPALNYSRFSIPESRVSSIIRTDACPSRIPWPAGG